MGIIEIVGAIAILVGIVAGIVQVLDYLEKRKEKKLARMAPREPQKLLESAPQEFLPDKRQDWGEAVDVSVFYGRQEELTELEHWIITDHCRLIAILGMGGIGKTALSVKLAEQIKDEFEYLFRRDLKNAPRIEDILGDCIKFLSDQKKTDLPEDLYSRISLVIEYLQKHRCLLILDNAETILKGGERAGHYREDYEGYGELLQRVGEGIHRSCLLLTSREKPKEVALLEGKTLPVRSFPLSGVKKEDGGKILAAKGLAGSTDEYGALTDRYQGNPLALKIIPTTILDVFAGDIDKFLEQGTAVFGDIRDVLEQQFERLSDLEKEIMYWLAINREPVSLQELKDDFAAPVHQPKLIEALESLGRRSLIEKSAATFTQQPVVLEYVTDRIVEQFYEELAMEKITLFNSHALIKATTKDYVRNSQIQLILKPILDRMLKIFSQKGVESKLKNILSALREKTPLSPGYAGGNAINFLVHLKSDLSDYDFSDLSIWQAYLQGVDLSDVNFSNSNYEKCVFTSIFGWVTAIEFSPDGKLLAMANADGEIILWQVNDGKRLFILRGGHTGWIKTIAFSPDNFTLISGSLDHTVRLWDINSCECFKVLMGHINGVLTVIYNNKHNLIATGSEDSTIKFWDFASGKCIKTFEGHSAGVTHVIFSPNDSLLISCSDDKTIKLWDINNGECIRTLEGHTDKVKRIVFTPDSEIIASSSNDSTVKLWDINTGKCLKTINGKKDGYNDWIWCVRFNAKGNKFATNRFEDNDVKIWDINDVQCYKVLQGHSDWIQLIAFSTDDSIIATYSFDLTLKFWNLNSGRYVKTIYGYYFDVHSIAFNPDGNILISGSSDGFIRLWDVKQAVLFKTLQAHENHVWGVTFNPDGQTFASSSEDHSIKIWKVDTLICISKFKEYEGRIRAITFSPDGSILAGCRDWQSLILMEAKSGKTLIELQGDTGGTTSVVFSSNGNYIAAGCYDCSLMIWDVRSGKCLNKFRGHNGKVTSVDFIGINNIVSCSQDKTIKLWKMDSKKCINTLIGHDDRVDCIKFNQNMNILASGSDDHTIKLWDIETGLCLKTLKGHQSCILSIAFHTKESILASSSQDGTIRLWNIHDGKCLQVFRSDRPYERMNITRVKGLSYAQKVMLKALGAVEIV